MIYLDHAASTPLDPRVAKVMQQCALTHFGNPSSQHKAGRMARAALDEARDTVAAFLGAHSREILFTSGGTEADNLAIKGVAQAYRDRGRHLVTSAIEHHAVLESCKVLEHEGFRVSYLAPDSHGIVTHEQVEEVLTPETVLVSIIAANNEIGTIQPIAEIGALCRARGVLFHTDAVQAAGEMTFNAANMPFDLLSLSAHKLYGPKGVGALYVRTGTHLVALQHGGQQEFERRAGSEALSNIVGFAMAVSLLTENAAIEQIRTLRDLFLSKVCNIPGFRLHGDPERRLAANANVAFAGIIGERLLMALDLRGICISTGAACSAGAVETSHVLRALGYSPQQSAEAIRVTLGRSTTIDEIRNTAACIREIIVNCDRGQSVNCR